MAKGSTRRVATTSQNPSSRYPRTARVNKLLLEVIATQLERREYDDPRLELVTITGVDTDAEFRQATVYFSALDTSASGSGSSGVTAEVDEVIAALDERRVAFQAAIGHQVRLKRTPLLRFVPDPAIIAGLKVESILQTIEIPEYPDEPEDTNQPEDTNEPEDTNASERGD